jgi:energy-coupling factor transporter ATP-binding protein EcfA2
LAVERLGRVNLVVGKNGVGKTTLLEALQLYGSPWPERVAHLILFTRDEVAGGGGTAPFPLVRSLFHGRDVGDEATAIIGPISDGAILPRMECTAKITPRREGFGEGWPASEGMRSFWPDLYWEVHFKTGKFKSHLGADGVTGYEGPDTSSKRLERDIGPPFLSSFGNERDSAEMARQWDRIALTDSETRALRVLQVISPVEALSFVDDPRMGRARLAKVRIAGLPKPVPLKVLGDGIVRMFQVAVALEYAAIAGGAESDTEPPRNVFPLLLIDEIEVGIHYSLHADLWRFIIGAARELGVQVFATTHSWDCIRGFQEAAAKDEQSDAVLIRLESGRGKSRAFVFGEEELAIVTREQIEVR